MRGPAVLFALAFLLTGGLPSAAQAQSVSSVSIASNAGADDAYGVGDEIEVHVGIQRLGPVGYRDAATSSHDRRCHEIRDVFARFSLCDADL